WSGNLTKPAGGNFTQTVAAWNGVHAWTYVNVAAAKQLSILPIGSGRWAIYLDGTLVMAGGTMGSGGGTPAVLNLTPGSHQIDVTYFSYGADFNLNYDLAANVDLMT